MRLGYWPEFFYARVRRVEIVQTDNGGPKRL